MHHSTTHGTFLHRVKRNIVKDLLVVLEVARIVVTSIGAVVLFLIGFSYFKMMYDFVKVPVLLYIAGTYLTLLSPYIVIPLLFVPTKYSGPIIGVSSFVSLILIFMV